MAVTRRTLFAALACLVFFAAANSNSQSPPTTPVKLAMKGYDPVAYFTEGKSSPGSSAFSHVWDGSRYQFASAAHRDMFAANPARFAPQYAGSCAASMANGVKVEADPEHWAIADGRLFLFGGQPWPEIFRNKPDLVANADQNWRTLGVPAAK